jgi:radical SAM protein with 4Fe4S-binding SPASM domain
MVFQAIPPQGVADNLELDAAQQARLIETIAAKQKHARALIMPVCAPEYWAWLAEQRGASFGRALESAALAGCVAGSGFSYIRFDGEVWPCNFIPLSAGNIRRQAFPDIWRNSPLLQQFRRQPRPVGGVCGECVHQNICGGCRGRAYAHTGDPLAADPACFLNR